MTKQTTLDRILAEHIIMGGVVMTRGTALQIAVAEEWDRDCLDYFVFGPGSREVTPEFPKGIPGQATVVNGEVRPWVASLEEYNVRHGRSAA